MRRLFCVFCGCALLLLTGWSTREAWACPFCGPPQSRLSERLAKNDVTVIAEWLESSPGKNGVGGSTHFRVIERVRGPEGKLTFLKGDAIILPRELNGEPGQRCLLFGRKEDEVTWESPVPLTEEADRYLRKAPAIDDPVTKRLEYYLGYLESTDSLVAMDALAEFAVVPYSDVAALAKKLPPEKLRVWLADEQTIRNRLGLYGMMLGLCGTTADAALLQSMIENPKPDYPAGLDGITFGYLLLTKSEGLDVLDEIKLRPKSTSATELASIMAALRVMWTDGGDRIPHERLRESMRLCLNRPETAGNAVTDLARWEDWSLQDRLMSIYGAKDFDDRHTRQAIAGYFVAASKSKSAEVKLQARKNLDKLRERDPAIVKDVERKF